MPLGNGMRLQQAIEIKLSVLRLINEYTIRHVNLNITKNKIKYR